MKFRITGVGMFIPLGAVLILSAPVCRSTGCPPGTRSYGGSCLALRPAGDPADCYAMGLVPIGLPGGEQSGPRLCADRPLGHARSSAGRLENSGGDGDRRNSEICADACVEALVEAMCNAACNSLTR